MLQLWLLQEAYGFDFVSKSRLGLQKSWFALHTEASETAGFHLWVSDACTSETSALVWRRVCLGPLMAVPASPAPQPSIYTPEKKKQGR